MVPVPGVEPGSQLPQSCMLSVTLHGQWREGGGGWLPPLLPPLLFFSPLLSRAPKYGPAAHAPAACGLARPCIFEGMVGVHAATRRRGDACSSAPWSAFRAPLRAATRYSAAANTAPVSRPAASCCGRARSGGGGVQRGSGSAQKFRQGARRAPCRVCVRVVLQQPDNTLSQSS